MRKTLSPQQVRALAQSYSKHPHAFSILQAKAGKVVCRVGIDGHGTAVLKLWARTGPQAWVHRITRTGPLDRELRILQHLQRCRVNVPSVLGSTRLKTTCAPFTLAAVLEDLGSAGNAMQHLKRLSDTGNTLGARQFEQDIIELTEALLRSRIVDADHSMINIIVTEAGHPARLDFEIARKVRSVHLTPGLWAAMLGRLVGTYAFTVQPEVQRANSFACRLAEHLRPPRGVLRRARRVVERLMDEQRRRTGIDTRLALNW